MLFITTKNAYCMFEEHLITIYWAKMDHCQLIHNIQIYQEGWLHYKLFEFKWDLNLQLTILY